ncbi:MAG: hypothetical protein LBB29_01040 [Holosporaceae bacterium]|jgi:hypothetical protein|nr:hypothetical protein [Holosporaceae bacterium]
MKKIAAMCFSLFMFPASFCTDMRNVAVSKESFRNVDVVSEIIRDAAWVIEDENNIDKLEQTLRQEKYQDLQNAKKLLLTIIGDKKAMTNGTAFLSWVYCRLANPIAKKTNVPASIPSEFYRSSTSALSLEDLLTISNLSKSASTKQSMDLLRAFIPYCICNCQKTLVDIYYGASHFFMNTEHEDIAIKLMERAASNTKPYDNIYDTCHLMLASLLLKNNEEDRGFEVLKHLLEKSSTNPIIRAISTRVLKLFVRGGLGYTQSSPDNAPFRNINFVVSENKKAGDFFKALIYEEMEKISRYPDGNEILAAHAFMDKLNQYDGIHVDAVKYIDAQTLIKGMNISKENRKYLLELIDSSEYGERLFHKIELFLAQSFDDNTELKQKILAEFKYAIRKSKVFRDAMLAFIARVESKPSVSASALYDFRQLYAPVSFLSSESSAISSSSSYIDKLL